MPTVPEKQKPYIKPSDAKAWKECQRRAWYDNFPPDGRLASLSEFDQLVMGQGVIHERIILEKLSKVRQVVKAKSSEHTLQLMAEGADVIYQAQLVDDVEHIVGFPDFLIRHENGEYQPADAKLARDDEKKEIQIQIGLYRYLLKTSLPGIVFLGSGEIAEVGSDADKLVNQYIAEMKTVVAMPHPPLVRYSHSKCKACAYYGICKPEFEKKGELSLIYGVDGRAAANLEKAGILTMQQLSNFDPEKLPDVPYLKGIDKKRRAVLQAKSWLTGEIFKLRNITLPMGTWIHFDIEDNPLESTGGKHVYLWGLLKPEYDHGAFDYVWTDSSDQDKYGWIRFLELLEDYKKKYPNLIIAHYSSHEVSTIRSYASRYEMRDHPIVNWLLGDNSPLFDIQVPILENLILPLQGYGLKDVCKHRDLVNYQWAYEESGSQWSVVQFAKFSAEEDPHVKEEIKKSILKYNFDDVMGTRKLEEWLRSI